MVKLAVTFNHQLIQTGEMGFCKPFRRHGADDGFEFESCLENICNGIQNIQLSDALVAKEKNFEVKLVAQAKKLKTGLFGKLKWRS